MPLDAKIRLRCQYLVVPKPCIIGTLKISPRQAVTCFVISILLELLDDEKDYADKKCMAPVQDMLACSLQALQVMSPPTTTTTTTTTLHFAESESLVSQGHAAG